MRGAVKLSPVSITVAFANPLPFEAETRPLIEIVGMPWSGSTCPVKGRQSR
jgi:hypothetical protein